MTTDELYGFCHEHFEYRDGKLYWKAARAGVVEGKEAGSTLSTCGYRSVGVKGKLQLAHRLVFLMHHGYLPEFVDHINRDKFDNRIENLREVTWSENAINRVSRTNRTGYRGVSKAGNRYQARIRRDNKRVSLGVFDTPEEAHSAYLKAAKELHGEFACAG